VLTGIDHLVIAVADPDAAASALESAIGLGPGGGGRHERLGTFNRLVWLGDSYLELIGVFDADLAAASWVGVPTLRALAGSGGLATWAISTDDIEGDVAALRERGSDLAPPIPGERVRPDGQVVRWRLSAPARLDRDLPPFLIEHDTTAAEWTPEDRAARANGPARLATLEIAVSGVSTTIGRYLRTTGLRFRPSLAGGGARDADLGAQAVRLRPIRDAATPATTIHLAIDGRPAAETDLLGCRWIVRPA
jgi:Glyoxalase-like domain